MASHGQQRALVDQWRGTVGRLPHFWEDQLRQLAAKHGFRRVRAAMTVVAASRLHRTAPRFELLRTHLGEPNPFHAAPTEEKHMQHPDVQIDLSFIESKAPLLGRILGCSTVEAIGYSALLWHWALGLTPAGQVPDGTVLSASDTVPPHGARVERAIYWKGPPGAFVEACKDPDVGLLEETPLGGLRVRGLDRYHAYYDERPGTAQPRTEG